MQDLKTEFIGYLNNNYRDIFCGDIQKVEKSIILYVNILDISALDNDEPFLQFKAKIEVEILDGIIKTYYSEYRCFFDNGISSMCLLNIETNGFNFRYAKELSEHFIPYITQETYEEYGIRFLKYYFKDDYSLYPIDIDALICKMGLKRIISFDDDEAFGKIVFADCYLNLSDKKSKKVPRLVSKGTMIINARCFFQDGAITLIRSTTVHECIHWHYHKKAFEILSILDSSEKFMVCQKYDAESGATKNMYEMMEVQANAITSVVMMLKDNLLDEYNIEVNEYKTSEEDQAKIDKSICMDLKNTFNVSFNSLVRRLNFIGISKYLYLENANFVPDFVPIQSRKSKIGSKINCINEVQYASLLQDETFKSLIDSEWLIYLNGYVVINCEKTVRKSSLGYELTEYALNNIDNCTISFDVVRAIEENALSDKNEKTHYVRYRKGRNIAVSIPKNYLDEIPEMISSLKGEDAYREFLKEYRVRSVDDRTFSEYLIYLMKKYGFTIQQLVNKSGCSKSTINNYRSATFANSKYSMEIILAMCVAMKTKPYETITLLDKAGFNIDAEIYAFYKDLIFNNWDSGLTKWNDLLKAKGYPVLVKR